MKYTIEIQESYGNSRNMQKIIKKNCFLAKTLTGRETKKDQERQKRGGALIRAGYSIFGFGWNLIFGLELD